MLFGALLTGVNLALLATANRTLPDRLAAIPELANHECFAADGHWRQGRRMIPGTTEPSWPWAIFTA